MPPFPSHIRYSPFIEVRIKLRIDRHAIQGVQIEPLLRESLNEAIRFWIFEHPLELFRKVSTFKKTSLFRDLKQLLIGHRAPKEV